MNIEEFKKFVSSGWCYESSGFFHWTPDRPSIGQCSVTALAVEARFGGRIINCHVGNVSHYFNEIDGQIHDLTREQFTEPVVYNDIRYDKGKEYLVTSKDIMTRYQILEERLKYGPMFNM